MTELFLLSLMKMPLLEQLQLEEALLRTQDKNYFIINQEVPPAIVLGSLNRKDEHLTSYPEHIPIIKRFSGGGSIVADENTIFCTFIFNKKTSPTLHSPLEILKWSHLFYKQVFPKTVSFNLLENDFVIDGKKCGGNAQYLQKERHLQHTSFLWDFDQQLMSLLKMPPKMPSYRNSREHSDFLFPLKNIFAQKNDFIKALKDILEHNFAVKKLSLEETGLALHLPHRRSTVLLRNCEIINYSK